MWDISFLYCVLSVAGVCAVVYVGCCVLCFEVFERGCWRYRVSECMARNKGRSGCRKGEGWIRDRVDRKIIVRAWKGLLRRRAMSLEAMDWRWVHGRASSSIRMIVGSVSQLRGETRGGGTESSLILKIFYLETVYSSLQSRVVDPRLTLRAESCTWKFYLENCMLVLEFAKLGSAFRLALCRVFYRIFLRAGVSCAADWIGLDSV